MCGQAPNEPIKSLSGNCRKITLLLAAATTLSLRAFLQDSKVLNKPWQGLFPVT